MRASGQRPDPCLRRLARDRHPLRPMARDRLRRKRPVGREWCFIRSSSRPWAIPRPRTQGARAPRPLSLAHRQRRLPSSILPCASDAPQKPAPATPRASSGPTAAIDTSTEDGVQYALVQRTVPFPEVNEFGQNPTLLDKIQFRAR